MPTTSGKWKTLQVISSHNRRCHSVSRMGLNAERWVVCLWVFFIQSERNEVLIRRFFTCVCLREVSPWKLPNYTKFYVNNLLGQIYVFGADFGSK